MNIESLLSLSMPPLRLPYDLVRAIEKAYATPPRAYHNIHHIRDVWVHFESVDKWHDPISVGLAILFHDTVYEPGGNDNELRSLCLAMDLLERHPIQQVWHKNTVCGLISLTAKHGSLTADEVRNPDAAHFIDCDMAILGAERTRFEAYEAAIRVEYQHVPEEAYRAGRGAFLRRLLALPSIYLSEIFRARYEARARENVAWALERLGSDAG